MEELLKQLSDDRNFELLMNALEKSERDLGSCGGGNGGGGTGGDCGSCQVG